MSTVTVGENLQNNDCTFEQRQRDIAFQEAQEAKAREIAKHSPFEKFVQVSLDPNSCKARRKLMLECPSAYAIFDFLTEKADGYNAVMCSTIVLGEALGLSQPTVFRALKKLREVGFIEQKKSGTSNVYLLNKQLVWKSWGNNYKYAEFGANIIISESEQEKPTKSRRMNVIEIKE